MTKPQAIHQLARTGLCIWRGVEIRETIDGKGHYTGVYRIVPAGDGEGYHYVKTMTKAFEVAAVLAREIKARRDRQRERYVAIGMNIIQGGSDGSTT